MWRRTVVGCFPLFREILITTSKYSQIIFWAQFLLIKLSCSDKFILKHYGGKMSTKKIHHFKAIIGIIHITHIPFLKSLSGYVK